MITCSIQTFLLTSAAVVAALYVFFHALYTVYLRCRTTPYIIYMMNGATDGVRTRDPKLGKLVLYQLSYYRMRCWYDLRKMKKGRRKTSCFQYILSCSLSHAHGADNETRTRDPRITNALLYQLSHIGISFKRVQS